MKKTLSPRAGMLELMEIFDIPVQDGIESIEIKASFSERPKIIVTKQHMGKECTEDRERLHE